MIQIDMPMPEKCSDCIFCDDNCSCVASDYNGLGINVGCAYRTGRRDIRCPLKEQEKAKVVFGRCKDGSFATECGHCGTYLDKAYSICPKCNKELDWNSNQD